MNVQLLVPGIIFGLSIGSIFFLLAIGLSLCFGLMLGPSAQRCSARGGRVCIVGWQSRSDQR